MKINNSFIFFHTESSNMIYLILMVHFNSDAKFLSEVIALYLDFIKFTVEKVNSHSQPVPNALN